MAKLCWQFTSLNVGVPSITRTLSQKKKSNFSATNFFCMRFKELPKHPAPHSHLFLTNKTLTEPARQYSRSQLAQKKFDLCFTFVDWDISSACNRFECILTCNSSTYDCFCSNSNFLLPWCITLTFPYLFNRSLMCVLSDDSHWFYVHPHIVLAQKSLPEIRSPDKQSNAKKPRLQHEFSYLSQNILYPLLQIDKQLFFFC